MGWALSRHTAGTSTKDWAVTLAHSPVIYKGRWVSYAQVFFPSRNDLPSLWTITPAQTDTASSIRAFFFSSTSCQYIHIFIYSWFLNCCILEDKFFSLLLPKYFPSVQVRGYDIIFFQIPLLLTFWKGVFIIHVWMLNKLCGRKVLKSLFSPSFVK